MACHAMRSQFVDLHAAGAERDQRYRPENRDGSHHRRQRYDSCDRQRLPISPRRDGLHVIARWLPIQSARDRLDHCRPAGGEYVAEAPQDLGIFHDGAEEAWIGDQAGGEVPHLIHDLSLLMATVATMPAAVTSPNTTARPTTPVMATEPEPRAATGGGSVTNSRVAGAAGSTCGGLGGASDVLTHL